MMAIDKKNPELFELSDGIIATMGAMLKSLDFEKRGNKLRIPVENGEVIINMEDEFFPSDSLERLNLWVDYGMKLEHHHNLDYRTVMIKILRFDGWSWNSHVLRSAPEKSNYIEIPLTEAKEIYGMRWLENCS